MPITAAVLGPKPVTTHRLICHIIPILSLSVTFSAIAGYPFISYICR